MINTGISFGNFEEKSYMFEKLSYNIQLPIFQYTDYEKNQKTILELIEGQSKIKVVHLPLDSMRIECRKIFKMMDDIWARTGCTKYVVHPNKGITSFINLYEMFSPPFKLCIETFGWGSRKELRTPLDIIQAILNSRKRNCFSMTIDTSHIDDIWFDHKIMKYLLKYTEVIHLSNRNSSIGPHLPFNHSQGNLPLIKFVGELKHKYHWNGDIILEYMPEYNDKLVKNLNYLNRLLK